MPLSKNFENVYVPAVPEIPARSAQTVCTEAPPPGTGDGDGSWQYQCFILSLPANTGAPVGMGSSVTVLSVQNGIVTYRICGTVWVPNNG